MTGEKVQAKRAKAATGEHSQALSKATPRGRKRTKSVLSVEEAFEILAQSFHNVNQAGEAIGLPKVRADNLGVVNSESAPRVRVVIEGAYYCPNCHALTFADSVANAKCERCNAES